jgi:hypothetical protein
LNALKKLLAKKSGEASYIEFNDWDDFLIVFRDIKPDDTMWIILSRKEGLSYAPAMARIPKYLNKYFQANSFVLAYPVRGHSLSDLTITEPASHAKTFEVSTAFSA